MFCISFCTAIKNRLHHLRLTLPKNLADNADYENLEFVIVDYNSNDGLQEWLHSEMHDYIKSKKIIYQKVEGVDFFERSHSRNIAFHLASGSLICNVDADNFIGPGFAAFISSKFAKNSKIFLTTICDRISNIPDVFGRVCCYKSDFLNIGGYNERMNGYGFEDFDLVNRLSEAGLQKHVIKNSKFLNVIYHNDDERIKEEKIFKSLKDCYLRQISPSRTELLFILDNYTCSYGELIDHSCDGWNNPRKAFNTHKHKYNYSLKTQNWKSGRWKMDETELHVEIDSKKKLSVRISNSPLSLTSNNFIKVQSEQIVNELVLFHSQYINRQFLKENDSYSGHSLTSLNHIVLSTSIYLPMEQWHCVLKKIKKLISNIQQNYQPSFALLGFGNHKGYHIKITWITTTDAASTLIKIYQKRLNKILRQHRDNNQSYNRTEKDIFLNIPEFNIAYGLYNFVQPHALNEKELILLSKLLTDIVFTTLITDQITIDEIFALCLYLRVICLKSFKVNNIFIRRRQDAKMFELSNIVINEHIELIQEIINDLADENYLKKRENNWMLQWFNACVSIFNCRNQKKNLANDISKLTFSILNLPTDLVPAILNITYN